MELHRPKPTIVCVGEALFDRFHDAVHLGGAPVNLAVHAQQLLGPDGGRAEVVSAVGTDDLGTRLRRELADRGLSDEFIQATATYPTGVVDVTVDAQGHPEFDIARNAAWDHIRLTEAVERLVAGCAAICFGTLAQRASESRATIRQLVAAAEHAWRVCDLNLRQLWWDTEVIVSSFQLANVVKLSANELVTSAKLLSTGGDEPDVLATRLVDRFGLELLVLTRGKQGTVLYGKERRRVEGEAPSFPRHPQADDVGAGDASCAAIVTGLIRGWSLERIVTLANQAGAYVASQPGATPRLPDNIVGIA